MPDTGAIEAPSKLKSIDRTDSSGKLCGDPDWPLCAMPDMAAIEAPSKLKSIDRTDCSGKLCGDPDRCSVAIDAPLKLKSMDNMEISRKLIIECPWSPTWSLEPLNEASMFSSAETALKHMHSMHSITGNEINDL
jgi:hypothetical protein